MPHGRAAVLPWFLGRGDRAAAAGLQAHGGSRSALRPRLAVRAVAAMKAQEEWQRLQDLFELALKTRDSERAALLDASGADAELKARILRMVAGVEQDSPAGADAPVYDGRRLGTYTLLQLIDTGGMGAVYLAERLIGGLPQRVALKVLAPRFAGPSFLERFRREQHILASLDHTHITRLLD